MPEIQIGDTTARPIATESEFDPVVGPRSFDTWEGSEEDLKAQAQLFMASGLLARVYPYQGPLYRMRVSFPDGQSGGEPPVFDTWERSEESAQEDIRSNPLVIYQAKLAAGSDDLGVGELNKWYKEAKENIKNGVWVVYANTARQAFSELLSRGTDAHEVDRHILRRRRLLHLNKLAQSEVLAVARIYSTQKLREIFEVPDAVGVKLPVEGPTTPSNTRWGWKRRHGNSVATPALNKTEETTEFVFAAWSTLLYEHIF
jgi:hypothetical protein